MKNLFLMAASILVLVSCRKIDSLALPETEIVSSPTGTVQNLGHVFSGTNVTWKIHPLDPNIKPLFTHQPNSSTGYVMLMIDNDAAPTTPFRFVAVDLQSKTSKVINVQNPDGSIVKHSLGRITRYVFGMDKNFYVATEAGGYLIQYNPNTQKAINLGQPFKDGNTRLDIFSLNVGSDSALYGGSFGGDGEVKTFRYKNGEMTVLNNALDNASRYVVYLSGDSRFTYAVCGKNNWNLYGVDRVTGEKRTLLTYSGNTQPISVQSTLDGVYARVGGTSYKISGFNLSLVSANSASNVRIEYTPYKPEDTNVPQVYWDGIAKKVFFKMPNGQEGNVAVGGIEQRVTATEMISWANNKLYISGQGGGLSKYTIGAGFDYLGRTSMEIYSIIPAADKVYISGYPKGALLEYAPNQSWTVNMAGFSSQSVDGFATTTSNPKLVARFQNEDAAGVAGPMVAADIVLTSNGYIVTGGNNDRITASGSREMSFGSSKNGVVRNIYRPEFGQYEFEALCLSYDRTTAFVGGRPKAGKIGKLYKYDPATNNITATYDLPLTGDKSYTLYAYNNDLLVGHCDDMIFMFDLKQGKIVWQQVLGSGQKIYTMAIGPNNSVYIMYMYLNALNFRLTKYDFTLQSSGITHTKEDVTELFDQDKNETTKPCKMEVVPLGNTGRADIYVSGFQSLYRIRI